MNIKKYLLLCTLFTSGINSAVLPVPDVDIGKIDPERTGKVFTDRTRSILSSGKALTVPLLTQSLDVGEAKGYTLKLRKINFVGNTVIPSAGLEEIYKPYYGKKVTLAKILQLIQATTIKYRDAGYILSQAYLPAQDIDKDTGVITIGIVEGYINEVRITSENLPYSTKLLLQSYGSRMAKERPLTKTTLERYALLAQDLQGGNIRVIFAPAPNAPGAANLEFIEDDHKLFGFEGVADNRGTRILGPLEFSGVVHQFNALYGNHTLFNAVRDDRYELRVYNLSHRQPLNSDGLALTLQGSKTNTAADFRALPYPLKNSIKTPGASKAFAIQLEYPFIRSRALNFIADLKLDGYDTETKFLNQILFKEKIRALRLAATVDWIDSYFFNIVGLSSINFEFTQGLNNLGAELNPLYTTRPNVKKNFKKLTGMFLRQQPLFDRFGANLQVGGQYAFHELVAIEEYGYGGRVIGLAYDPYELSGDHGLVAKAELNYALPTEFISNALSNLKTVSLDLYGFYDAGIIWNINSEISRQAARDSAESAGFGLRGNITRYFNFQTYVAKPLTRKVQNEQNSNARFFLTLGVTYL